MIKLATIYRRTSKAGKTYWAGRMGAANVLVFEGANADDNTPTMDIVVAERDEQKKPQQLNNGAQDYARPHDMEDRR